MLITGIRHGNALPGENDLGRCLSEKGIRQTEDMRSKIAKATKNEPFDIIFTSKALRTKETAWHVTGSRSAKAPRVELPMLFESPVAREQAALEEMFGKLGYSPLAVYRKKYPTKYKVIMSMAKRVARQIQQIVPAYCPGNPSTTRILIAGHAIMLPAVLYELNDGDHFDEYFSMNMGEAEAVIVRPDTGRRASETPPQSIAPSI